MPVSRVAAHFPARAIHKPPAKLILFRVARAFLGLICARRVTLRFAIGLTNLVTNSRFGLEKLKLRITER